MNTAIDEQIEMSGRELVRRPAARIIAGEIRNSYRLPGR